MTKGRREGETRVERLLLPACPALPPYVGKCARCDRFQRPVVAIICCAILAPIIA
jgi:hypothetical protein